jgi:ABC-type transporter Mla maintaining outer membrane lipid asymmetry ATPase subunit MlaF
VLSGQRITAAGTLESVLQSDDAYVREFFHGARGERVFATEGEP